MTTAPVRPATNPFTTPADAPALPLVSPLEVQAEIVTITPAMAKEWLHRNTHNRPIRTARVHAYARVMATRQWHLNGDAIKIAPDGTILDGQPYLLAVPTSGATTPHPAATGPPPATHTQRPCTRGRPPGAPPPWRGRGSGGGTSAGGRGGCSRPPAGHPGAHPPPPLRPPVGSRAGDLARLRGHHRPGGH